MPAAAKIVYIDMDDTICDFKGAYMEALRNNPKMNYPQAEYGFFANLDPIDGALDAINALLESDKYKPYILTAPSIQNPMCYAEKRVWVEKHLGIDMVKRLIISPDKSLLRGDYLIDDYTEGKGQEAFEGQLIQYGSEKYPNWKVILGSLEIVC